MYRCTLLLLFLTFVPPGRHDVLPRKTNAKKTFIQPVPCRRPVIEENVCSLALAELAHPGVSFKIMDKRTFLADNARSSCLASCLRAGRDTGVYGTVRARILANSTEYTAQLETSFYCAYFFS